MLAEAIALQVASDPKTFKLILFFVVATIRMH